MRESARERERGGGEFLQQVQAQPSLCLRELPPYVPEEYILRASSDANACTYLTYELIYDLGIPQPILPVL